MTKSIKKAKYTDQSDNNNQQQKRKRRKLNNNTNNDNNIVQQSNSENNSYRNNDNNNLYLRRSTRSLHTTKQIIQDLTKDTIINKNDTKHNNVTIQHTHIQRKPIITEKLRDRLTTLQPYKHISYKLTTYTDKIKGQCVKSINKTNIQCNTFVIEYGGELIVGKRNIQQREQQYIDSDDNVGCYMFMFNHNNKTYCIDATMYKKYMGIGRYINHSAINYNLYPYVVKDNNNKPHLCFFASQDIQYNAELLIDYGDRSSQAVEHNPWLLT